MRTPHLVIVCLWAAVVLSSTLMAAPPDLPAKAREAMLRSGLYWAEHVASHGGYVWEYSTDFTTRRRGESRNLPLSTNWVQAGTPSVGETFLACYAACGDKRLLAAARAAGTCLAYGQLMSGGWHYSIEHDPARVREWYVHLGQAGKGKNNTTTFDDDNTQSATRFLMELDRYIDDPEIDATIERALRCFLVAQYQGGAWDGAWPQRYPPPKKGYGAYPTFNDNTMSDCVRTVLKAYHLYQKPELLQAVKRCLAFYLRAQQPPPQAAWPQQVDHNLAPAWARRFEPPSVTGAESCGNCRLLMDMAVEFGDKRYLDAVGRCVDWYKRSRIGGTETNGIWARFYELKTNRPLYFTRTYKLTYDDSDLPVHYSFKGNYGVNAMMRRYEALAGTSLTEARKPPSPPSPAAWAAKAKKLEPKIERIVAELDETGRWVRVVANREEVRDKQGRVGYVVDENKKIPMMYTHTFVRNMRALADYLVAVHQGPVVSAPNTLSGKVAE